MQCQIEVRVIPNAKRDQLDGTRNGAVLARVSAPPDAGRANRSLCRLISDQLNLPLSAVTIVKGERSRNKRLSVELPEGGNCAALLARLTG